MPKIYSVNVELTFNEIQLIGAALENFAVDVQNGDMELQLSEAESFELGQRVAELIAFFRDGEFTPDYEEDEED